MFCTNCGKKINDDSLFCTYCGTKLVNQNINFNIASNNIANYKNNKMTILDILIIVMFVLNSLFIILDLIYNYFLIFNNTDNLDPNVFGWMVILSPIMFVLHFGLFFVMIIPNHISIILGIRNKKNKSIYFIIGSIISLIVTISSEKIIGLSFFENNSFFNWFSLVFAIIAFILSFINLILEIKHKNAIVQSN